MTPNDHLRSRSHTRYDDQRAPLDRSVSTYASGFAPRTDTPLFPSMTAPPTRAAAHLALNRMTTRSSSPASRRTSASSVSSVASSVASTSEPSTVSTRATSISSCPPFPPPPPPPPTTAAAPATSQPPLTIAEKNRQKQQRYRDRIKDTISTLRTDNDRLEQENRALQLRVEQLLLRNAELGGREHGGGSGGGGDCGKPEDGNDDGELGLGHGLQLGDTDDEATPLAPLTSHHPSLHCLPLTPPVPSTEAPPAPPRLESLPTLAPTLKLTPPAYPGLRNGAPAAAAAAAATTVQGHSLERVGERKASFSNGPSPLFSVVDDGVGVARHQPQQGTTSPSVLGSTPSNVLGLRFDSPRSANPFGVAGLSFENGAGGSNGGGASPRDVLMEAVDAGDDGAVHEPSALIAQQGEADFSAWAFSH